MNKTSKWTAQRATLRDIRRAEWWRRAEYFAWSARKGWAPARDPLTGSPYPDHDPYARLLGRAVHLAAAREAYAIARSFGPLPLP